MKKLALLAAVVMAMSINASATPDLNDVSKESKAKSELYKKHSEAVKDLDKARKEEAKAEKKIADADKD